MSIRPLRPCAARWRPAGGTGLEHLDLRPGDGAISADGVVIGERGGRLYRCEAVDDSFAADLPVDEDGLATDYPGLFTRLPI